MYGVIEFYRACKAGGVKPIIGIDTYVANRTMRDRDSNLDKDRFHLLLLAQNQTGYQNLLKIASAAQLEGYYYRPRVDHDFLTLIRMASSPLPVAWPPKFLVPLTGARLTRPIT